MLFIWESAVGKILRI